MGSAHLEGKRHIQKIYARIMVIIFILEIIVKWTWTVIIGNYGLIAPNVQIYTAFHPTNGAQRFGEPKADGPFAFCKTKTAPVIIGDKVWIVGGVFQRIENK